MSFTVLFFSNLYQPKTCCQWSRRVLDMSHWRWMCHSLHQLSWGCTKSINHLLQWTKQWRYIYVMHHLKNYAAVCSYVFLLLRFWSVAGSTCHTAASNYICNDIPLRTTLRISRPVSVEFKAGFRASPPKVCFSGPNDECTSSGLPTPATEGQHNLLLHPMYPHCLKIIL